MITRRRFIRAIGKSGLAVAIVTIPGCSDETPSTTTASPLGTEPAPPTSVSSTTTANGIQTTTTSPRSDPAAVDGWQRVVLGNVSAYLLVDAGEAILIDTGGSGSASQIAATMADVGVGWNDLSTVILTHHHGDHVGSLNDVMVAAESATAYAGAEDIPSINSPRPVTATADGDVVAGLEVIATPGHTPGSISLLDSTGVLVAGDALTGTSEGIAGPNPQFTPDTETADQSVIKLAGFTYEVIYVGHGDPVLEDGSAQVAELAASL